MNDMPFVYSYSIQGADLSTRQEGNGKFANGLTALFTSFDWESEQALQSKLEVNDENCCPAGLSIVRELGTFLHLCPNPDGSVMTHCIHSAPTKILGLFKSTRKTNLFAESLDKNVAIQSISKFVACDEDWLIKNIKEDTSHE